MGSRAAGEDSEEPSGHVRFDCIHEHPAHITRSFNHTNSASRDPRVVWRLMLGFLAVLCVANRASGKEMSEGGDVFAYDADKTYRNGLIIP